MLILYSLDSSKATWSFKYLSLCLTCQSQFTIWSVQYNLAKSTHALYDNILAESIALQKQKGCFNPFWVISVDGQQSQTEAKCKLLRLY